MKILSFQPCSLYQNGGAGRLLRRLYLGHESQIISLFVNKTSFSNRTDEVREISISAFPVQRTWMRWKLRPFFAWIRDKVFFSFTKNRVIEAASKISYDVLHVINHGIYSGVLCDDNFLNNKKLWVSFHDHFSLCSSFDDTQILWNRADRRLVISNELGLEYQRLFGNLGFEFITDGVAQEEISIPKEPNQSNITIYFAGLLHIDYYPLFEVLADALDNISDQKRTYKLILRGTQKLSFLNNRNFNIEYRTDFVSDIEIKKEIDAADILYLPIKFTKSDFYLYSLSTKMIGYLGGGGTILYHGPENSAANRLLQKNNAAISCISLNVNEMMGCLAEILKPNIFSANAMKLAQSQFVLENIQKVFWNE